MKTKMRLIFLASILFLSFTSSEALAFRCGNGLVSTGDTKSKVRMTCAEPTSKEKTCKDNWTSTTKSSKTKKRKCNEKVEIWYYNCGDNDFIYALTFEDNVLIGENSEGRGKGKSDCSGK